MPKPRNRLGVLAALAALVLSGCGTGDAGPVASASRPLPHAVRVPDAGADAVLRLSGRLANVNAGGELRLDARTLASLGVRDVELYEPFQKRRATFRAIPLRSLLQLARPREPAKVLHAAALNDYVVDLPLDVATADGVYLALANGDGSPIAVEDGGPIRIVFADHAKGADVENYWIWSLATVTLR